MSETKEVKQVRHREVGEITQLNHGKGFGFILDYHNQERFFHVSQWADKKYRFEDIEQGDKVSFIPYTSSDGQEFKAAKILVRDRDYLKRREALKSAR